LYECHIDAVFTKNKHPEIFLDQEKNAIFRGSSKFYCRWKVHL